ncbi:MAG: hypothetical protein ACP5QA_15215, partial [Phycisphaerae bacterium]
LGYAACFLSSTTFNSISTLYAYDDANHAMFTLPGVVLNTTNNTLTTTGPISMSRSRIPFIYSANGTPYMGLYSETMTFSANTPISYTLAGSGSAALDGSSSLVAAIPTLPGFTQGNGASSGFANVLNLIGNGTSSAPQYTIQTLARSLTNSSGQVIESDQYAVIDNATYLATGQDSSQSGTLITNQLSGQAPNGNYYATRYAYDSEGRMYQTVDANGTITDTVFDALDRVVATWVGTNDGTSDGNPFNGVNANSSNNMTQTSQNIYGSGTVGDSNITETIAYPDGNTAGTQRVTLMSYDFRDRQIATESGLTLNSSGGVVQSATVAYPPINVSLLDNLGNNLATLSFNGGATTLAAAITAAVTAQPGMAVAGLVGYSTSEYDSQNRDYQDQTFAVDPTTGTISTTALTSYTYYGPRGNVIATISPTGLVNKYTFDGADRQVMQYSVDAAADPAPGTAGAYAAAQSVANDIVIQQTATGYDGDGNAIETVTAQRFSTDPQSGTGSTGALFVVSSVSGDGSLTITPASQTNANLAARIYYSGMYYDNADRVIASVNAGTNPTGPGGTATPWTRPSSAPVSYNDPNFAGDLITLTSYNPAGWQSVTTDARGVMSLDLYNNLGETIATIANYSGAAVPQAGISAWLSSQASPSDQVTEYTYDGLGDQTSMTAINVDANTLAESDQTTTYIYGVSPVTGSTLTSNSMLYQTQYPSLTSQPSQNVSNAYDALGETVTVTDRNGNVHQITYDNLGRQISDAVTTLGANVDGSVRRIDTAYNNQGLAYLFTSYADTAGTQIVNQVENVYNGLGQITQQYQAVNGAVDTSSTPSVQYTYSDPSIGSIPMSVIYPNGRSIYFGYEAGIDGAIGRLSLIMDGANSGDTNQVLEQYSYLGLSTIVGISRPQTGIDMNLLGTAGSVGAGGDAYTGLDQFGRIASQQWATSTGTVLDGYTYTYDQNNNVTSKTNVLNSAYSETYTNDNLNRLTAVTRGGQAYQSWNLDSQGNWSSSTTTGTTQTRTTDAQNQITSITGTAGTPQYDANGNMITDQNGNTLKYDAWNRLVSVTNPSGQVIAEYTYNAISQRVTETYPVAAPGIPA